MAIERTYGFGFVSGTITGEMAKRRTLCVTTAFVAWVVQTKVHAVIVYWEELILPNM